MRQTSSRLRLLAAAAVLPIVGFASASPAHAQDDETFAEPAQAAAGWLASQADGPSWAGGDVSSSLDAVIGLMAAGVGGDQVQTTLEWLNHKKTLSSYVYPASDESDKPQLNVGGAGKVMYVVATAGGDATNFGGIRLGEAVAANEKDGVYGDGTPITQAWAVLGLSRTDQPAGEDAAAALAAAQCDDGGFNYGDSDGGKDCVSDPDTTGLVASALQTMDADAAATAYGAAIDWLESHQSESGGFDNGFGDNANSTAYAAQALLGAGSADAAEFATAFIIGLQIPCGDKAAGAIRATDPEDKQYGDSMRVLATAQALIPLSGQNLAELDASDLAADAPKPDCTTSGSGSESPGVVTEDDDSSTAWVPWVIIGAVIVLAAIIAYFIVRGRRETAAAPSDAGTGNDGDTGEGKDAG